MRSMLQQGRRIHSRALLLPRLSSSSSSSLPRRLNSSTPPPDPFTPTNPSSGTSASSLPPTLQLPSSPTPSQLPSTRQPPPPLHVRSRPRSTISPPPTTSTTDPSSKVSSSFLWLSQIQTDNHRAKAVALAARLEAEGSEVLVSTSELFEEVRKLFRTVSHLARASDEHLEALSTIYHRFSTSPAALQEDGREWIRLNTARLLSLFTRRSNLKSNVHLPSLRLVLKSGLDDLDLLIRRGTFRSIGVGLASGAKGASEAVEIVEGLRRLSPSSFTDTEFEELLQAIGRVEDWTAIMQDTFQLPSFTTPLRPLPPPPRPASPPSSKQPTTPTPKPKLAHLTTLGETSSSSSPRTGKSPLPSPPSSSSRSDPPPPTPSSRSTSSSFSQATSTRTSSSPSSRRIKDQVTPSPFPPSSSNNPQEQRLLEFSRILSSGPPPSMDNLRFLHDSFTAAFKLPLSAASHRVRIEIAVHILTYASRTPPLPSKDRHSFAGLVSLFVGSLKEASFANLTLLGPDVRKDVSSLVGRMASRGQVDILARFLYQNQKEDFGKEELKVILETMAGLPAEGRQIKAVRTYEDWEKGFGTRLGEMMEDASSSSSRSSSDTLNSDTDAEWIDRSSQGSLRGRSLARGEAYGLLHSRSVEAPSSSESLVVASRLYLKFAPPDKELPFVWRQHGDAIVRMLLLCSNHQGNPPPSFNILGPILRDLPLLPPSFIPSTPSFPSFSIPLLSISTNLDESLLVISTILHAQEVNPTTLLKIWSTFLSSLERHSTPPSPFKILTSKFFKLVNRSSRSEVRSPLQDLIEMYLRRWRRAEATGSKEGGAMAAFETLREFIKEQQREGVVYGASLYASLMETLVVRKDWKGVFRLWEEIQEGAGVDAKSVEMYLLACLATSSQDQARTLITIVQSHPTMLPLLTPQNWSLYYSVLAKAKTLPFFVESIVWQAKEENASPLAVEDLAKGIKLAREVGGLDGEKAEGSFRGAVKGKMLEEAERIGKEDRAAAIEVA